MRALTGRNASKGNGKEMAEGREEAASSEGPKKEKVGKAGQAGQSHPWMLRGQAAVRLAVLLGTLKDLLLGTVRKKQSEQGECDGDPGDRRRDRLCISRSNQQPALAAPPGFILSFV